MLLITHIFFRETCILIHTNWFSILITFCLDPSLSDRIHEVGTSVCHPHRNPSRYLPELLCHLNTGMTRGAVHSCYWHMWLLTRERVRESVWNISILPVCQSVCLPNDQPTCGNTQHTKSAAVLNYIWNVVAKWERKFVPASLRVWITYEMRGNLYQVQPWWQFQFFVTIFRKYKNCVIVCLCLVSAQKCVIKWNWFGLEVLETACDAW